MNLRIPQIAIAGLLMASAADAAVLTFDHATDYTSNFRRLEREGTVPDPAATNGALRFLGAGGSRITTVFDATPANATERTTFGSGLQVSFDARIPQANQSIGIYLINAAAATENQGYLALVNADYSGNLDRIRFAPDANPSLGGAGTLTEGVFDTGYNVSSSAFVHIELNYTIDALDQGVLEFTVGNVMRSYTIPAAYKNVEVALRVSAGQVAPTNYIDIDNFSAAVPEPAAFALAALSGMLVLRRRRA